MTFTLTNKRVQSFKKYSHLFLKKYYLLMVIIDLNLDYRQIIPVLLSENRVSVTVNSFIRVALYFFLCQYRRLSWSQTDTFKLILKLTFQINECKYRAEISVTNNRKQFS